jgi:predicted lipoprotein with Yx(FWY)xxD motif
MTLGKSITGLATLSALLLVAFALTACGSNANGSATPPMTASGQAATIGVTNTGLGNILVNSRGRTLYLFQKDAGTQSACTGACAVNWPPLRANSKVTLGNGAKASLVGTTTRSDGTSQVTYNGHPLYLFVGDHKAGDTNGEGVSAFGGGWFALSSSGSQVTAPASNSGGGGGYGY